MYPLVDHNKSVFVVLEIVFLGSKDQISVSFNCEFAFNEKLAAAD